MTARVDICPHSLKGSDFDENKIQVQNYWTSEALIDELQHQIIQVKEEPEQNYYYY